MSALESNVTTAATLRYDLVFAAEMHHLCLIECQFLRETFQHTSFAKAATEDDNAFRAHPYRGKQLTSIGNSVTTRAADGAHAIPEMLHLQCSPSLADAGMGEAKVSSRHRA